jgi:hypothetical protein
MRYLIKRYHEDSILSKKPTKELLRLTKKNSSIGSHISLQLSRSAEQEVFKDYIGLELLKMNI